MLLDPGDPQRAGGVAIFAGKAIGKTGSSRHAHSMGQRAASPLGDGEIEARKQIHLHGFGRAKRHKTHSLNFVRGIVSGC